MRASSNENNIALLALCEGNPSVTSEFPSQRPVTRSLDVFFDRRLNKRWSKQLRCRYVWDTIALIMTSLWCDILNVYRKRLGTVRFRNDSANFFPNHYDDLIMGVSNHQPHDCLLNRLFRRRSKKTSKLCATGLCAWNSPGSGEFPAQMASHAENVSIWWRHHVFVIYLSHA